MLSPTLHEHFEALLTDYRFASLKHYGREWAAPKAIAELILMGWRTPNPTVKKKSSENVS
jgi:hypothetical protein